MEISDRNVLITGSAKRVGREIALSLARAGANIAVHYNHSKKEAEELVRQINDLGVRSIAITGDISISKNIPDTFKKASDLLGGIDILINNAAIFYPTQINDIDEDDWTKFLDINLKAPFYLSREFARVLANKSGKIINIADGYALSPAPAFLVYGVSKGALVSLTKALAKAYAPKILVNCICPGPILPPKSISPDAQQRAIQSTLLKRTAGIEDITKTIAYLIENDYITGQAIFVDGGRDV